MTKAIAIVGTDTDVGKTAAARSLCSHFTRKKIEARVIKPFETGVSSGKAIARYRRPLSPYGAIRRGERQVPLAEVNRMLARDLKQEGISLIEGIGGVTVPLQKDLSWIDFHARRKWPAVIIARAQLGTINHTVLTIEALERRRIPIIGFVLNLSRNRKDSAENAAIIEEVTGVESLGVVRYDQQIDAAWRAGAHWDRVEEFLEQN